MAHAASASHRVPLGAQMMAFVARVRRVAPPQAPRSRCRKGPQPHHRHPHWFRARVQFQPVFGSRQQPPPPPPPRALLPAPRPLVLVLLALALLRVERQRRPPALQARPPQPADPWLTRQPTSCNQCVSHLELGTHIEKFQSSRHQDKAQTRQLQGRPVDQCLSSAVVATHTLMDKRICLL